MEVPDRFKFDVRVRDRMLNKGTISAADVQKSLDALPDLEGSVESIELSQPAVTPPGERQAVSARPVVRAAPAVVAPISAPMSVPPPPLPVDDGWGADDDDEDDDDEDDDDDDAEEGEAAPAADKPPGTPEDGAAG